MEFAPDCLIEGDTRWSIHSGIKWYTAINNYILGSGTCNYTYIDTLAFVHYILYVAVRSPADMFLALLDIIWCLHIYTSQLPASSIYDPT